MFPGLSGAIDWFCVDLVPSWCCYRMDDDRVVPVFVHVAFCAAVWCGALEGPCVRALPPFAAVVYLVDVPLVCRKKIAEVCIVPLGW